MALCLLRWFWRGDVPNQAEREVADRVPRETLLRWLGEFGPEPVRDAIASVIGFQQWRWMTERLRRGHERIDAQT